jgi:hypothetical protein
MGDETVTVEQWTPQGFYRAVFEMLAGATPEGLAAMSDGERSGLEATVTADEALAVIARLTQWWATAPAGAMPPVDDAPPVEQFTVLCLAARDGGLSDGTIAGQVGRAVKNAKRALTGVPGQPGAHRTR